MRGSDAEWRMQKLRLYGPQSGWRFSDAGQLPDGRSLWLSLIHIYFFREAKETGVFELYYLDLSTGLRRGELLGLKWSDINLNGVFSFLSIGVCRNYK